MFQVFASFLISAALPTSRLSQVGYIPVTVRPGTNVVENLPATPTYQPQLSGFASAKAGDMVIWRDESHTFDGKAWSGRNGGAAKIPIPERFTVIRTAKETDVWNIGIEIDMKKLGPGRH